MMIEHVDAITDIRRDLTMRRGNIPEKTFEVLENLRHTENLGGHDPKQRANWALDLGVRVLKDGEETEVLFWPGEAAFELRHQKTLRFVAQLLQKAGTEFAIPDLREADIGDFARRVGEESLFEKMVRKNIQLLASYQFKKILTADPHVYHSLKNEYSQYGGHYDVYHHTEFLLQLLEEKQTHRSGKKFPTKSTPTMTLVIWDDITALRMRRANYCKRSLRMQPRWNAPACVRAVAAGEAVPPFRTFRANAGYRTCEWKMPNARGRKRWLFPARIV